MLTPYPQIVEYNEAVQHPETAFRDPELRQGRVKASPLGLPVALSGGFALTYMMATPRRTLALRCFHREIPAGEGKYAAIARALEALRSPYFVDFEYVPDGIRIRGGFYPVLKMEWAEGAPLGIWLDRCGGNRRALETLREAFAALAAFLEQSGLSHGDIQNGNVIVSRAGLRLVDYDGMYVPGMPRDFSCETGHKHFQHPGRTTGHFGPGLDRFAFIAIDLSLAALIADFSLYRRFGQSGETILFRAVDYADPDRSDAFRSLQAHAELRDPARDFAAVCQADIAAVPTLADFRAGRAIPVARRAAVASAGRPAAAATRPLSGQPRPSLPRNRDRLFQLLQTAPAPPARAPVATAPVTRAAAGPPRTPLPAGSRAAAAAVAPAVNNQRIIKALRSGKGEAATANPRPNLFRSAAAARPVSAKNAHPIPATAAASSPAQRPQIPKSGSFVIHPRNRQPPPAPPLPPAPEPTVWQRVMRFLGIEG